MTIIIETDLRIYTYFNFNTMIRIYTYNSPPTVQAAVCIQQQQERTYGQSGILYYTTPTLEMRTTFCCLDSTTT
jgi:hypothetical protein